MVQPLILAQRKAREGNYNEDYDAITAKAVEVAALLEEPVEVLPAKKDIVNKANAARLAINQLRRRAGLPGVPFASRTDSDAASPADDLNTLVGHLNELIGEVSPPVEAAPTLVPAVKVGVTTSVKTSTTGTVGAFLLPNGTRSGEAPVTAGERWIAIPGALGSYRPRVPAGWQVVQGSERQVTESYQSGLVMWWRDITQADITAGLPSTVDITLDPASSTAAGGTVATLQVHRFTGGSRTAPPTASTVGSNLGATTLTHPGVTVAEDNTFLMFVASAHGNTAIDWVVSAPAFTDKVAQYVDSGGDQDVQRVSFGNGNVPVGPTGPLSVTASYATRWSASVLTLPPLVSSKEETPGTVEPTKTVPVIVDNKITTTVTSTSVTDVFTTNVPCSRVTEYRLATNTGARTQNPYTSEVRTDHRSGQGGLNPGTDYDFWYTFTTEQAVEATYGPFRRRTAAAVTPPPNTGSGITFGYQEPQLTNPLQITLGGATGSAIVKDPTRDVLVTCNAPVTKKDGATGITIQGGRNWVIRGAHTYHAVDNASSTDNGSKANRGMSITGVGSIWNGPGPSSTPRTIFVGGLKLSGVIRDGVTVDLSGDTNVEIIIQDLDTTDVTSWPGSRATNHPDLIQPWNGPKTLRLNRIWAPNMSYQGIFLQQKMYGRDSTVETHMDNVHVEGTETSAYLLWSSHDAALHVAKNAPDSVTVYSRKYGATQPAWDRILWDSTQGGAGQGRWTAVKYQQRSRAQVLGS